MTKERRSKIVVIVLELERIKEKLLGVLCEEELSYSNMPENLQGSLRGCESEEAIDIIDESIDSLEEIINNLGGI